IDDEPQARPGIAVGERDGCGLVPLLADEHPLRAGESHLHDGVAYSRHAPALLWTIGHQLDWLDHVGEHRHRLLRPAPTAKAGRATAVFLVVRDADGLVLPVLIEHE